MKLLKIHIERSWRESQINELCFECRSSVVGILKWFVSIWNFLVEIRSINNWQNEHFMWKLAKQN